jgi:predicted dehydrogenase
MAVRIGMIGMGAISPFYQAAIGKSDGAVLAAACDIDSSRLNLVKQPGVALYNDYRDMLGSDAVDAVIITAPNDAHFALAAESLSKGKHLMCEKPLTTRSSDAEELVRLAQANGKSLMTAFHRRYNHNFRSKLPELSDRSQIRSVFANYCEDIREHSGPDSWYLDPRHCGGGCIADNGPNVFDTLRFFLGHMDVVGAEIGRIGEVDVHADLKLTSEDAIPIDVRLDWKYPHGEQKDLSVVLRNGRTVHVNFLEGFDEFKGSLWHEYEGIVADFLEHIRAKRSDADAGCDAVRLVEAAYQKEHCNAPSRQA